MTIKPLADRVVIKTVEAAETTKSGIILTASAQEKPSVAEVVAVGPGGIVEGKEVKMFVKIGDKVLISKYSGNEVKVDGVEYSIVRQDDILAVVEDSEDAKAAKPAKAAAGTGRGGRKPAAAKTEVKAEKAPAKRGRKTASKTAEAAKSAPKRGRKPKNA